MPRLHSHLTELATLPIPSWSLTNLLASLLLLFLFLTPLQPPLPQHGLSYLYYCTGFGRKGACPLARDSNISETRRAQREQAAVPEKSASVKKSFEDLYPA